MSELADILRGIIRDEGPVTVARYMSLCLGHPRHGYYMTRDPLGRGGDFTTAPEISQMFGELVGIWVMSVWDQMGRPDRVRLVELGPGRGTLMDDLTRTGRAMPDFRKALEVHLVETSPTLRHRQAERLAAAGVSPRWHERVEDVPEGAPTIIIANEFFDALAIRQVVSTPQGWRERMVGLDAQGEFVFGLAGDPYPGLSEAPPGTVREIAPEAARIMAGLGERIARDRGAVLAIDYGYARSAPGDTLQALRDHGFANPLEAPGEADLTAHVDFEALARAAASGGAEVHPLLTQGAFLLRLGLAARTGALGAAAPARAEEFRAAAQRLAGGGESDMGVLFKAFAATSPGLGAPPAFDSPDPAIAKLSP